MKASKEVARTASQLFSNCIVDGKLDEGRVRQVIGVVKRSDSRDRLGILTALHRLLRIELAKRQAVVESAVDLSEDVKNQVTGELRKKYGDDLQAEFKTNPSLIGGMKIRIGSDVWDGSVKARLQRLADKIA